MKKPTSDQAPDSPPRAQRRAVLLDAMADHLLEHGLAASPLRALAAAASTSDRMLLYYFADKDELLTALLEHVAARLATLLDAGDGGEPRPYATLLAQLWSSARAPAFRPFMLLFLELAAAAGRGNEPHRTAAGRIARGFAGWIAERLDDGDGERHPRAALLLATLDGLFLMHSAGCEAEADVAASLI